MSTTTQIGQKQAVVNAVAEVLGSSFVSGTTVARDLLTAEQLSSVRESVFSGIMAGSVAFSKPLADSAAVRRYVNGMIDNHLRKASELNGSTKYVASGSPRGSRDPQLSTLRKLLKTYEEGSEQYAEVLSAISAREATLASEKAAARSAKRAGNVDISSLPAELQAMFSSSASA